MAKAKSTKTRGTSLHTPEAPNIPAAELAQGLVEMADLVRSYANGDSPVREDEGAALRAILTALAKHRRRPRTQRFRTARLSEVSRKLAWARVAADAVLKALSAHPDSEARQASIAAELANWLSRSGFTTSVDSVRRVIDELRRESSHVVKEDWIVAANGPVEAAGLIIHRVLRKVVKGASSNNTRKLRQVLEAELDSGAFVGGPRSDLEFLTFLLKALGVPSETAVLMVATLTTGRGEGLLGMLDHDVRAARTKPCPPVRATNWWAALADDKGRNKS